MLCVDSFQEVINECSSRGNQHKFYNNGYWYKLDGYRHYEGLAEEFVSLFEGCIVGFNYVSYKSCSLEYNGDIYNGCVSRNMYGLGVCFISIRQLFRDNNIKLRIGEPYTTMCLVIDTVGKITGLDIRGYLRDLLYLDALIINEDRHFMNLGVCYDGNKYLIAPCFDNGSSLFCINWTYRKSKSLSENLKSVSSCARPFSKFYDTQIQLLQRLGARPLILNYTFVRNLLSKYTNSLYKAERVDLIKNVLRLRLEKYRGIVYEI